MATAQRDEYVGEYPVVAIRRLVNGNCTGMRRQSVAGYQAWIESFIKDVADDLRPRPGERYQYWMGKPFPRGDWVPCSAR